ncbi:MAG: SsrA-binding protein [Desulfotomaculum sp. 46_296]|nr:MAG: SsrA-binding protein [Desulfotomaculum sp. 46_296]HAU32659.1 SsrA-binding protein [Desulfotomaculum sp.]
MDEKIVSVNRKARHEYHLLDTFETGIVLTGTEVKSIRAGNVSMRDSYAVVENAELFLYNLHISPFEKGNRFNHEPRRTRKLLAHKSEIMRLLGYTREKGLTIIPLRIYFNERGRVKVELAVARGKKTYDKREDIAKRDAKREMERTLKDRNYKN